MAELVRDLVSLRGEISEIAPDRETESDGWIGDTAHQQEPSDHNPDETGNTPYEDADNKDEVHAIDVDRDLNEPGWSMERVVQIIVHRHRTGEDNRLNYVIFNRRIWASSWGWSEREYTGSNPHDKHAHFSSRYGSGTVAQGNPEENIRSWGLLAAKEEDDMPSAKDVADEVIKQFNGTKNNVKIDPSRGLIQSLMDKEYKDIVGPSGIREALEAMIADIVDAKLNAAVDRILAGMTAAQKGQSSQK